MAIERAVIGGGCFWCLEAVFDLLDGVVAVTSGYCGGRAEDASYPSVCSGTTDHAEVVAIDFDTEIIGFEDILRVFFTLHDPTSLNRQGNDVGRQYRSVIFVRDAAQEATVRRVIAQVESEAWWPATVVTEIAPSTQLLDFFPAEPEHQAYFRRNPHTGYCAFVVAPKVAKLRARFFDRLKRSER